MENMFLVTMIEMMLMFWWLWSGPQCWCPLVYQAWALKSLPYNPMSQIMLFSINRLTTIDCKNWPNKEGHIVMVSIAQFTLFPITLQPKSWPQDNLVHSSQLANSKFWQSPNYLKRESLISISLSRKSRHFRSLQPSLALHNLHVVKGQISRVSSSINSWLPPIQYIRWTRKVQMLCRMMRTVP